MTASDIHDGTVLGSQISGDTSPVCRLWPQTIFGKAGQNHRRTVRKLGYQRKIPSHGLNRFSKRGQQDIAPFFQSRNTVLADPALRNLWEGARLTNAVTVRSEYDLVEQDQPESIP